MHMNANENVTGQVTTAPWVNKLVVFDTETTGVDVTSDRIVMATIALLDNGQVTTRYDWIINPGVPIPPGATAVHKITDEIAQAQGMPPKDGIAEITETIARALQSGYALVAFNASYDCSILKAEAQRHGVTNFPELKPVIDPWIIDRFCDRYRRGKRTLSAVCAMHGVTLTNAHDSGSDALAAGALVRALAHIPDVLDHDVFIMHNKQIAWEEELTLSLKEYLRKNNLEFEHITPGWPTRLQVS
ncbi:3'-5' exonuclease [Canibacter sp. lx-45]|uniref:exonuclease domain-containing protein n=1 Tax=Canibacter zhuwentaonis TaxID=2837491 RepID=UPI001BDC1EC5|nr:exonuclease domain-containing protein [Canibacter zhuwentaonis]MBT1035006.1 3'-5' exonuclease [Canibacter zhuwentaonis]